jgi:porin
VFDNGQFMVQFTWSGEVNGRAMHLRVFGFLDSISEAPAGEDVAGGGVSWDWWVAEKVGLFVRIAANGSDSNPSEFDASVGVALHGLIGSRPDDTIGVAVGFISLQAVTVGPLSGYNPIEDTEFTLELYYRFMAEEGKLQISPFLQVITDPGGGVTFTDDTLFLLGVRMHVPF